VRVFLSVGAADPASASPIGPARSPYKRDGPPHLAVGGPGEDPDHAFDGTISLSTSSSNAMWDTSRHSADGLAAATARGEAARIQWVKDGLVVPGEQLAQAWGLTRQALAPAADRGEVFAVKVCNRLYYPQVFLGMDREAVSAICRALGDLRASDKLMFWLRDHGALAGRSVAAALEAGMAVAKVERLAAVWARERGAARVAVAA
jgi:hypothetical protein